MAKLGFVNTDVNKITCVSCNVSVSLRPHLNFCGDEITAAKWYKKITQVHMADCIFKEQKSHKFPVAEFANRVLEPHKFVMLSRKIVYIRG